MTKDAKIVTLDARQGESPDPADHAVLESPKSGVGLVTIGSVDEFMKLAEAAKRTFDAIEERVRAEMTPERAAKVRQLRVDQGYSWRGVARAMHDEWPAWQPPSSQIAGMALCQVAAEAEGKDFMEDEEWN